MGLNQFPKHIQGHHDTLNIHGINKEKEFTQKHLAKLIEKRNEGKEKLTSLEKLEIWAGENLLKTLHEIHDKLDKIIRGH